MSGFKRHAAQDDRPTAGPVPAADPAGRSSEVVLELQDLVMHFGAVRAVDGVSLQIRRGKVTALVGRAARASPPSAAASCAWWSRPVARCC